MVIKWLVSNDFKYNTSPCCGNVGIQTSKRVSYTALALKASDILFIS